MLTVEHKGQEYIATFEHVKVPQKPTYEELVAALSRIYHADGLRELEDAIEPVLDVLNRVQYGESEAYEQVECTVARRYVAWGYLCTEGFGIADAKVGEKSREQLQEQALSEATLGFDPSFRDAMRVALRASAVAA